MDIYSAIGQQIKKARKEKGVGQKALASVLNYTPSTISQYEAGKRCILLTDLEKLAVALNYPLNYFIAPGGRTSAKKKKGIYVSLEEYQALNEAGKAEGKLKKAAKEAEKQKAQARGLEAKIHNLMARVAEQSQITSQVAGLYNELKKTEEKIRGAEKITASHKTMGNVAYQLNNPLTILLGFIQMLISEKQSDDPKRQDLIKLETSAKRCVEIITGLINSFTSGPADEPIRKVEVV